MSQNNDDKPHSYTESAYKEGEKYTCVDCGAEMSEGERKTFTVCETCWDKAYAKYKPVSAPSESQDKPSEVFSIHRYEDGRVEGYKNGELIKFDPLKRFMPSESQEELSFEQALQDQNKLLNSQVIKDFIAQNKITELESENKALQEKLKIADHIKELADDAIVTLQKEIERLNINQPPFR